MGRDPIWGGLEYKEKGLKLKETEELLKKAGNDTLVWLKAYTFKTLRVEKFGRGNMREIRSQNWLKHSKGTAR